MCSHDVIERLDLSDILRQLAAKTEYAHWTPARFFTAAQEYREFLTACKNHPEQELSPTPDADEVWHRHMLNSRCYMRDCQNIFGYYLHHEPLSQETQSGSKCSRRPCTTCKPTKGPVVALNI